MAETEMGGFIFAVVFLFLFPMMLSTIPADFQGIAGSPEVVTPLDPALLVGFEYAENWTESYYYEQMVGYYDYGQGGYLWRSTFGYVADDYFSHYRKITVLGVWLGGFRTATFYCANDTNRGTSISFAEINGDAEDGFVRYDMILGNGDSAGALVFGWNNTLYPDCEDAWDNDALVLVHGMGIDATQSLNIGDLLLGLLFWQIPDVPFMLQAMIVGPLYADIAYIVWFIVINMIPFLGGG